jgi:hypothetical protein
MFGNECHTQIQGAHCISNFGISTFVMTFEFYKDVIIPRREVLIEYITENVAIQDFNTKMIGKQPELSNRYFHNSLDIILTDYIGGETSTTPTNGKGNLAKGKKKRVFKKYSIKIFNGRTFNVTGGTNVKEMLMLAYYTKSLIREIGRQVEQDSVTPNANRFMYELKMYRYHVGNIHTNFRISIPDHHKIDLDKVAFVVKHYFESKKMYGIRVEFDSRDYSGCKIFTHVELSEEEEDTNDIRSMGVVIIFSSGEVLTNGKNPLVVLKLQEATRDFVNTFSHGILVHHDY